VITAAGRQIGFDACIVAVGGVNDTFGVPGAHAMPFKSVARSLASIEVQRGCEVVEIDARGDLAGLCF
jgi:NADH dehydrogenase FAD-containing subunit